MGAHTALSYALRHPERVAGLIAIGPTYTGDAGPPTYWDGLAEALEQGGIDGFVAYIDREQETISPWRDSVLRFTRERMERHRDLGAIVLALRQLPRSRPFGELTELESLAVPTLVVASHDEADPGHPYAVAEEYARRLPAARLVSEGAPRETGRAGRP